MPRPTRADDEVLLAMLDLHDAGMTSEQIGRTLGIGARTVAKRIREVVEADIAADPTSADAYWRATRRRPRK